MAIGVMQWVWTHSKARKGSRLVLLAIADCAAADGTNAYPSMAELIRKTALSERGVQAAIADLERLGELAVDRTPGKLNTFRVVMTPAESAPPQEMPPADSAGVQEMRGAENAPPQNLPTTPAESAGGTVIEPSGGSLPTGENTNAGAGANTATDEGKSSRRKRKGGPRAERTAEDDLADELTNAYWERYPGAQSWIAIRQVVRTALGNGLPRDDVAWALGRVGGQSRPVTQATMQFALAELAEGRAGRRARASPSKGHGASGPHIPEQNKTEVNI